MPVDPYARTRPLRLISDGPDATRAIAAALAPALVVGDVLILRGGLGAGKTCFTQGLGAGLGVDDPITSPTFTLANRYQGRLILHHLDAYRLDGEADAADLDLDDLRETGVTVIEWGDRIDGLTGPDPWRITLGFAGPGSDDGGDLDRRIVEIDGPVDERGLDGPLTHWVDHDPAPIGRSDR